MSTPVNTQPPSTTTSPTREATAYPDFYDTLPCLGCGFLSAGCYFQSPECYGCATENFQCCIRTKTISCRGGDVGDAVCICSRTECDLTEFKPRCKSFTQTFCTDCRCAIPPENQSPFILNLLCFTFYFRDHWTFKFCAKASEL